MSGSGEQWPSILPNTHKGIEQSLHPTQKYLLNKRLEKLNNPVSVNIFKQLSKTDTEAKITDSFRRWRDGSWGASTCCANLTTCARIPRIYIKAVHGSASVYNSSTP